MSELMDELSRELRPPHVEEDWITLLEQCGGRTVVGSGRS